MSNCATPFQCWAAWRHCVLRNLRFLQGVVAFHISVFVCAGILQSQTRYFVDPVWGSDTNAGVSRQEAWKTVARLRNHLFRPGDKISFKRGGIWREQLDIHTSGSVDHPITFGTYGNGANPVIDGSRLLSSGWIRVGSHLWMHRFVPRAQGSQDGGRLSNVFFDNRRGVEVGSIAQVNSAGEWYYNQVDMLYIYSAGDPAKVFARPGIEASDRYGIVPNGMYYITVDGIDVKKCNSGGIWNTNHGTHLTVKNDTLSYNGQSAFYSNGNCTTFLNAVTRDNGRGWHDHGFYFQGDSMLVERILSYDNAGSGLSYNGCGGTIRYCISHDNGSFTNYRSMHKGFGGDLTTLPGQKVTFCYNVLHDNYGIGVWVNCGDGVVDIYNNVIAGTKFLGDASGLVVVGGGLGTLTVKNNIFYAQAPGSHDLYVVEPPAGLMFDHNCYYGTARTSIYWKGAEYSSAGLSQFRSNTRQERNGISADPMFIDPGKCNFRLRSESPVISIGVPFGCTADFAGTPVPTAGSVSAGAFQYTGPTSESQGKVQ